MKPPRLPSHTHTQKSVFATAHGTLQDPARVATLTPFPTLPLTHSAPATQASLLLLAARPAMAPVSSAWDAPPQMSSWGLPAPPAGLGFSEAFPDLHLLPVKPHPSSLPFTNLKCVILIKNINIAFFKYSFPIEPRPLLWG